MIKFFPPAGLALAIATMTAGFGPAATAAGRPADTPSYMCREVSLHEDGTLRGRSDCETYNGPAHGALTGTFTVRDRNKGDHSWRCTRPHGRDTAGSVHLPDKVIGYHCS
jgi:hypothetical protein